MALSREPAGLQKLRLGFKNSLVEMAEELGYDKNKALAGEVVEEEDQDQKPGYSAKKKLRNTIEEQTDELVEKIREAKTKQSSGKVSALSGKLQEPVFFRALVDLNQMVQKLNSNSTAKDYAEIIKIINKIDEYYAFNSRYGHAYLAGDSKDKVYFNLLSLYRDLRKNFVDDLLKYDDLPNKEQINANPIVKAFQAQVAFDEHKINFYTQIEQFEKLRSSMGVTKLSKVKSEQREKEKTRETIEEQEQRNALEQELDLMGLPQEEKTDLISKIKQKGWATRENIVASLKNFKSTTTQSMQSLSDRADRIFATLKDTGEAARQLVVRAEDFKKGVVVYKATVWFNFVEKSGFVLKDNITPGDIEAYKKAVIALIHSSKNIQFLKGLETQLEDFHKTCIENVLPQQIQKNLHPLFFSETNSFKEEFKRQFDLAEKLTIYRKKIAEIDKKYMGGTSGPTPAQREQQKREKKAIRGMKAYDNQRRIKHLPEQIAIDKRLAMLKDAVKNGIITYLPAVQSSMSGLIETTPQFSATKANATKALFGIGGFAVRTIISFLPLGDSKELRDKIQSKIAKVTETLLDQAKSYTTKKIEVEGEVLVSLRNKAFLSVFGLITNEEQCDDLSQKFTEKLFSTFPFAIDGVFLPVSNEKVSEEFFKEIFQYVYESLYEALNENPELKDKLAYHPRGKLLSPELIDQICTTMVRAVEKAAVERGKSVSLKDNITKDFKSYRLPDLFSACGKVFRDPENGSLHFYKEDGAKPETNGYKVITEVPPGFSQIEVKVKTPERISVLSTGESAEEKRQSQEEQVKAKNREERYQAYYKKINSNQANVAPAIPTTTTGITPNVSTTNVDSPSSSSASSASSASSSSRTARFTPIFAFPQQPATSSTSSVISALNSGDMSAMAANIAVMQKNALQLQAAMQKQMEEMNKQMAMFQNAQQQLSAQAQAPMPAPLPMPAPTPSSTASTSSTSKPLRSDVSMAPVTPSSPDDVSLPDAGVSSTTSQRFGSQMNLFPSQPSTSDQISNEPEELEKKKARLKDDLIQAKKEKEELLKDKATIHDKIKNTMMTEEVAQPKLKKIDDRIKDLETHVKKIAEEYKQAAASQSQKPEKS